MGIENAGSGGEGLERSCKGAVAGWLASSTPVEGVELFRASLTGEVYQKHRHDTYAVGVTDRGVQVFDYRGSARVSTRGQVVVLYPDEAHDGRAGTTDGFGYRIIYIEPAYLSEALRAVRGRPYRSEEHTSELQSQSNIVCRLLLEKKQSRHDRPVGTFVTKA